MSQQLVIKDTATNEAKLRRHVIEEQQMASGSILPVQNDPFEHGNRPSLAEIREMYREAHPKWTNAQLKKKVRQWKHNVNRMAVRKTMLTEEIVYEQTPASPPSTQAKTPQIPSPITIMSPPKVVTFPSPNLPKDEDELAKYYVQKWRGEQQQAEDGLMIEEVIQEKPEQLMTIPEEPLPVVSLVHT